VRALLLVLLLMACPAWAQDNADASARQSDRDAAMLRRIETLEAEIKALKAQLDPATRTAETAATAPTDAAVPASETEKTPTACTAGETSSLQCRTAASATADAHGGMDHGRGGHDVRLGRSKTHVAMYGDTGWMQGAADLNRRNSFAVGEFDLFATTQLSPKLRVLAEASVWAATQNNRFWLDLQRMFVTYAVNDYFQVSLGRYHTAIGYYNTAYHHSAVMQNAIGRPFLYKWEWEGGVLPVHNVGVSATGRVPSGRVGLHYVVEAGNGRTSSLTSNNPVFVQNLFDENDHKSVNVALYARPDFVPGMQVGFSIYHDLLTPLGKPKVGENISAAHFVFSNPSYEFMNEAILIQHSVSGGATFNTPGFYSQVSKRFGQAHPYFRYEYFNGSKTEPIFPAAGRRNGPAVGVRFDVAESAAFKLQYNREERRNMPSANGFATQFAFAF
jgi:hypothetical protein